MLRSVKKLMFLSLILIFEHHLGFSQVKGVGFGFSQEQARNEALADVSSQISVQVQSTSGRTVTEITGKGFSEDYIRQVLTKTQLPILGATFTYKNVKNEFECLAVLNPSVTDLYKNEIIQIQNEAKKLSSSQDLNDLSRLLTLSENYSQYRVVLTHFSESADDFPISVSEIQKRYDEKAGNISSLNEFSAFIKRLFKENSYYIYAPEVSNSKEITPFAATLRQRMMASLPTTTSLDKATFLITGSYSILEDRIELNLKTVDKEQKNVKSASFRFLPSAYEGLRFKPESADLESLISQGLVLNNELRPELRTSIGKTNLLFYNQDKVELFVKMNKPGYLYIMGHVNNSGSRFSYLLPINGDGSKRDFVLFINADDANKWISLGEFEIEAPFGTEILQVFASSDDIVDRVPDFYINDSGYPVIGTNPDLVVTKTRGMIKKKKTQTNTTSEFSLTYTTMEKN